MPERITHGFSPVFDERSRVLILGTMPSVKSRQQQFYYMHPQNRFWKLLAALLEWEYPASVQQKREMLLCNRIALWDVLASCQIRGSADSSIAAPAANDLLPLLQQTQIQAVFANGRKAHELYQRLAFPLTRIEAACLPSTSPANAAFSLERLLASWQPLLTELRRTR